MDCLESVSKIAQMLTAGYMPSPVRAHSSSENILEIGTAICQMEQDYKRLSTLTAAGLLLVIGKCQICSQVDIYQAEKLSARLYPNKDYANALLV